MANLIDLSSPAKQVVFAEMIGVSQSTVAQHFQKGRLPTGGTYGQWLLAYTDHIRNEAAGRGGSLQEDLARAKIDETTIRAASGKLDYMMKVGMLVPTEFATKTLRDWAAFANREYLSGINELISDIQSSHKIDIDTEVVTERAGAIIRRIRDHAEKLQADLGSSGE